MKFPKPYVNDSDLVHGSWKLHESYEGINSLEDLGDLKIRAIGSFFEAYNAFEGKKFKVLDVVVEAKRAHKLIRKQEI